MRTLTVAVQDATTGARSAVRVSTADDWVIPTGGEYFFAPSIEALKMLAD